jgi:hypothetical protein
MVSGKNFVLGTGSLKIIIFGYYAYALTPK